MIAASTGTNDFGAGERGLATVDVVHEIAGARRDHRAGDELAAHRLAVLVERLDQLQRQALEPFVLVRRHEATGHAREVHG